MKSKAEILQQLVQSKLPHARVFWDPSPDEFFETKSCELFAVNLNKPNRCYSIQYVNGIAAHPVENLADDFLAHVGPKVAD